MQPGYTASHRPLPTKSSGASHPPLVLAANRPPSRRVAWLSAAGLVLGVLFVVANLIAAIVNAGSTQRSLANAAATAVLPYNFPGTSGLTAAAVTPTSTSTIVPTPVPAVNLPSPQPDRPVHLIATAVLHSGPGQSFPARDVLAREIEIIPLGRTQDAGWLYIMVANNAERGWVDMRTVAIPGGLNKLDVAILLPLTPLP